MLKRHFFNKLKNMLLKYLAKISPALLCCLFLQQVVAATPANLPVPQQNTLTQTNLPSPHKTDLPEKTLSLREAIYLALRQNPDIQNAHIQRVADKFALEVAHYEFQPHLSLTGGAVFEHNAGGPAYTLDMGASLNTPQGGNISVEAQNEFVGKDGPAVTFKAVQPLLRGAGTKVTLAKLHNAVDQEKINKLTLKQTVMTTITNVTQAYLSVVDSQTSLLLAKDSLEQRQKVIDQTKKMIKAGRTAPRELAVQESDIASLELSIEQAQNQVKQAYQNLLVTIGLDPTAKLRVPNEIDIHQLSVPNQQRSKIIALDGNTGYVSNVIGLNIIQRSVTVAKSEQLWKLDLEAEATVRHRNRLLEIERVREPDTNGSSQVGLSLDVPINDLPRQQELVDAEVTLKKAKISLVNDRRQLETDVINRHNDVVSEWEQVQLAIQAEKLAEEAYRIERVKWQNGLSTFFDLNTVQDRLLVQQLRVINQKTAYLNSVTSLNDTLGTLPDLWGIKIEY